MRSLTRRAFLTRVSAGATVLGLSHLLDPTKALADTAEQIAAMVDGQSPGGVAS